LTSATLSINDNFEYFKKRLGGEKAEELKLPSQFDFFNQVKLYIPNDIPEPQKNSSDRTKNVVYIVRLTKWIHHFIKMTKGKALVLFTNSALMKSVREKITEISDGDNIEILIQEEGMSRKKLLAGFKENVDSVLFGLDSFWLGIDVPGESLSNLIITRLPFRVPDHPLIQAKMEFIDNHGGNSFFDFSLPEAIFKFRQGVGRLIRSKNDTGIIAILDKRIISKPYGRHFLNSIEECPVEIL